jgi:predicted nicotinamide N-methyase
MQSVVDRNAMSFEQRYESAAVIPLNDGTSVRLEQSTGETREGETEMATVWTAASVLAAALQDTSLFPIDWASSTVLELGSGTGLCGIVAAKLGARELVLTDLPELLPLLRRNATMNDVGDITSAMALDWRDESLPAGLPEKIDVILGSDITVFIQQNEALAVAMEKLSSRDTRIILAAQDRGDCDWLLEVLGRRFECERVPFEHPAVANGGGIRMTRVDIFALRLREPKSRQLLEAEAAAEMEAERARQEAEDIEAACRGDIAALKRRMRQEGCGGEGKLWADARS